MKQLWTFIKNNKAIYAAIIVAIMLIAFLGGITFCMKTIMVIGYIALAISSISAFVLLCTLVSGSGDKNGCLVTIVCSIIAIFSYKIASSIDDYYTEKDLYEQIKKNPSTEECERFLRMHPESKFCDSIWNVYYYHVENQGVFALKDFADNYAYTNSELATKASKRTEEICDSLYNIALQKNTIESWTKYKDSVPTKFHADSNEKIDSLKNLLWNTDEKAWQQATTLNTIDAYSKYLNLYPNGEKSSIAEKKIIDLKVSNVFSGNYESLPEMEQIAYNGGSISNIRVYNNTSYTLTLLYSGNDSKELVLSPQSVRYINLRKGTYHVVASVSASNVRNCAGIETLKGGSYSVEYYISTSYSGY